ncbi:phage protein Gp36 family protein [Microbacterium oxydans]|uniref:phage protein Gp36 family protein n=1 Tax=Microbacterium oxydans TaxID=82380 RepID=UPI003641F6C8
MSDIPTIRYCEIEDIRMKAGFEKASNLADRHVQAARRAAQAEIDSALGNAYTVPFTPIPEKIRELTIKLAAYSLKHDAFNDVASAKALEALRKQLAAIAAGETPITDDEGQNLSTSTGVDGYFGDEPRMFTVGQRF